MNPPPSAPSTSGGNLLVKVDTEGAEWTALLNAPSHTLKRIRQLVVEFHSLHKAECHAYYQTVFKHIFDAGFAVAHIHGNNWGTMDVLEGGKYRVPEDLEVTFVNKESLSAQVIANSACVSEQDLLPQDARNRWIMPDLPLAELPSDNAEGVQNTKNTDRVVECRFFCNFIQTCLRHGVTERQLQLAYAVSILLAACILLVLFKWCSMVWARDNWSWRVKLCYMQVLEITRTTCSRLKK